MATPTPSHPGNPTSASKKPGQHASTPRSVPSPVATRKDQAGKTPINHPTTGSSQGSKTLGGTPMILNLSQSSNMFGNSPNPNMMGFGTGTPLGLGVEGLTPGQLNMPTPGMSGMPMNVMSELGMTASGGQKRNEDEERRAKLRKVIKSIGTSKGRVSEEGIARVGRRVGFQNGIDNEKLPAGDRAISTAGQKLIIDIELKNHVPQKVQVAFDTENEHLAAQGEPAAEVLLKDLQPPEGVTLTAKLDKYAANLGRLAKIDRLCHKQVNCFEALSGVYVSLRRLFEQEVRLTDELSVLRTKSGRPTMHANGRLGLDLEYWQADPGSGKNSSMMDVDDTHKEDKEAQDHASRNEVHKLRISIESSHAGLYPSIRLSDAWLPDHVELPAGESNSLQGIPWQDPPPTFVTIRTDESAMSVDGNQKAPGLRFTAKLEPPIVLPWQVASNIMQSVHLQAPQLYVAQAWHSLLLDPTSVVAFDASKDAKPLHAERQVLTIRKGEEVDITHVYSLDVVKPEFAYKLEELPFSHPRQLVEMLPILRQYACVGSLIRGVMADTQPQPVDSDNEVTNWSLSKSSSTLADLLTPPSTPPNRADKLPISLTVATSHVPTVSLNFPTTSSDTVANVTLQILPNAELAISSQEGLPARLDDKTVARALELVGGDVGVWVEWLRNRQD